MSKPINIGIKTLWHVLTRIKLYFHTPVQFLTNAHLTYYFISKIVPKICQHCVRPQLQICKEYFTQLILEQKWKISRLKRHIRNFVTKGPLKIWTKHFNPSHFMKLQLRGDLKRTPGTPFRWILSHWARAAQIWTFFDKLRILASCNNLRIRHDPEFVTFWPEHCKCK